MACDMTRKQNFTRRGFLKATLLGFGAAFLAACAAKPATATLDDKTPTAAPISGTAPSVPATEVTATPVAAEATEMGPTVPQEGDTKLENGYTYAYTVIRSEDSKELYQGWFRPMTPVKIPFWDWTDKWYGVDGTLKTGQDIGNMMMLVGEGVPGADAIKSITHAGFPPDRLIDESNMYMQAVLGKFTENFSGNIIGAVPDEQWKAMNDGLQAGTIKYTIKAGSKEYAWYPSPEHGAMVYVLKYDKATQTEENGFLDWKDYPNKNHFHTAFLGLDSKGNILGSISSEKPLNELEDWELQMMQYYHMATAVNSQSSDQNQNGGFSPFLQILIERAAQLNPPYIEVER